MTILPQQLALILPLIVTALAGWLGHDGLPEWANEVITLLVLAASVAAWVALGGKLSNDIVADIALVAGYSAALVAGPLAPLRQWLFVAIPSPLAGLAKKSATAMLARPAGSPSAPQRASAQSSAAPLPTWAQPEPATTTATAAQSIDEAHGG
jgi:hypothetical protein